MSKPTVDPDKKALSRSVSLTKSEYENLIEYGNGNASFAVRGLLSIVNELRGKGLISMPKGPGCVQLKELA